MFGELVPIPAHADPETVRHALGSFILSHLLSSPVLEKAYANPAVTGGFRQGQLKINKITKPYAHTAVDIGLTC